MSLRPSSDSKDLSTTFFVDVGKHVASEDRCRTWTCNEAGKEAKIGFFVVVFLFCFLKQVCPPSHSRLR